jgi:CPA1 family monovalent cation:H+ antiporter
MALPPNFPERDRLIFIAFVVVSATLLLQGLTLPALVKLLGVRASVDDSTMLEQDLMHRAQEAGMRRLDELRSDGSDGDVVDRVQDGADRMWHALSRPETDDDHARAEEFQEVRDAMLTAAREEVVEARSQSGTDPTVVDDVLRRLDVRGTQFE